MLSDEWRAAYAAYEAMADATLTASERHAVEQGFIAGHGAGMEFLRSRGWTAPGGGGLMTSITHPAQFTVDAEDAIIRYMRRHRTAAFHAPDLKGVVDMLVARGLLREVRTTRDLYSHHEWIGSDRPLP